MHLLCELAVPRTQRPQRKKVSSATKKGAPAAAKPASDPKPASTDSAPAHDDDPGESHVDDPVRMYLMQMGEIPMLNRDEEVSSAPRRSRRPGPSSAAPCCATTTCSAAPSTCLRRSTARSCGSTARSRSAVTNTAEKKRVLKRLGPNLATIHGLLELNTPDFLVSVDYASHQEGTPRGVEAADRAAEQDRPGWLRR